MKKLVFLLTLSLGLWTLDVYSSTYYVSKGGLDAHGCSTTDSASTNKQTVNAGLGCLAPGDTLLIHAGTYSDRVFINTATFSGTSWATATKISAFPGETVILKPVSNSFAFGVAGTGVRYMIFTNLFIDGSLMTAGSGVDCLSVGSSGANHIRFVNCDIGPSPFGQVVGSQGGDSIEFIGGKFHGGRGSATQNPPGGGYGIYSTGNNYILDGVEIYDCTNYGIHNNYFGGGVTSFNTVKNCIIHDIFPTPLAQTANSHTAIAILFGGGNANDNLVYNNVIYSIAGGTVDSGYGVVLGAGARTYVYNNTIYNVTGLSGSEGIRVNGMASAEAKNNIVYQAGTPIDYIGPAGAVITNNLADIAGTGVSTVGNPLFINTSTHDFHIQSSSPARTGGTSVGAVTVDKDGVSRPQGASYSRGAYEFSSPDVTPPVISSIANSSISDIAATITWTTNETADSQVEYGLTTGYGTSTTLDTNLVVSHSVGLSGLTQATLYHYRVKSKDTSANLATSADQTFTTTGTPFTATIATLYPNGGENFLVGTTETLRWNTDDPGNLKIEISFNNGATYSNVTGSVLGSLGAYDWPVTSPVSSQVLFKWSSLTNSGTATSAAVNKISGNYIK